MKIKNIIIASAIIFLAASFALADARPLEVQYPSAGGTAPTTVQTPLADYVAYIYRFIIIISGLIALGAIAASGITYLTSTGNPSQLDEAKQRLLSAFWGTLLLFASYLILYNISPQLLNFSAIGLPSFVSSSPATPAPPPTEDINNVFPQEDYLIRVKNLTQAITASSDDIKKSASELKSLTDQCSCQNTQAACACNAGGPGAACQPKTCYAGGSFHPCKPNSQAIEELQKTISKKRDALLFLGNWALAEKDDLKADIDNIITPQIKWHDETISNDLKLSGTMGEFEKQSFQKIIDYLAKSRENLQKQKDVKNSLMPKLEAMAAAVAKLETPASGLAKLPSFCFENVKTKCQSTCKTGGAFGCHDARDGCQADKCSGPNPCPVADIQTALNGLNQVCSEIINLSSQIAAIIGSIQ